MRATMSTRRTILTTPFIQFYTEGIKVNCKDEELNAILYSNRAAARFNLGEKFLLS